MQPPGVEGGGGEIWGRGDPQPRRCGHTRATGSGGCCRGGCQVTSLFLRVVLIRYANICCKVVFFGFFWFFGFFFVNIVFDCVTYYKGFIRIF